MVLAIPTRVFLFSGMHGGLNKPCLLLLGTLANIGPVPYYSVTSEYDYTLLIIEGKLAARQN